jgi:hypothetical protein
LTGNDQPGHAAARPPPANPAMPEDSKTTKRRCSTSRPTSTVALLMVGTIVTRSPWAAQGPALLDDLIAL